MLKKSLVLIVLVILTAQAFPIVGAGSPPTSPLLTLLSQVPDGDPAHQSLSYVDMDALFAARPGATRPTDYTQWDASSNGTDDQKLTLAVLTGIRVGPNGLLLTLGNPAAIVKSVGIDLFTIHQMVEFGAPPSIGTILAGDFDPAAIGKALSGSGFVSSTLDTMTIWCSPDGCDQGAKLDPQHIDIHNPFGGDLGRREPIVPQPDRVLSSSSLPVVQSMLDVHTNGAASLADNAAYRATAEALAAQGSIIQVFIPDPARVKAVRAAKPTTPALPDYGLVTFAHVADSQSQQGIVALEYDSASGAQTASEAIVSALAAYQLSSRRQPFTKVVTEFGGTLESPQVFTASNGKSVVLVTLRAPIETADKGASGRYTPSGTMFRLLIDLVDRRDVGWLGVPSQ
ncbi:MAG TPA: hypothetical protein VMT34_11830 [Aggregatilineales bacterium]|nr:hypothetical protein [Aggregatilineales bacterium]